MKSFYLKKETWYEDLITCDWCGFSTRGVIVESKKEAHVECDSCHRKLIDRVELDERSI